MGAPQTNAAANSSMITRQYASDSDWEYEYDETETEDFYFTLDLPPTDGPAAKRRKTTASEKDITPPIDSGLGSTRSQDTISTNPAQSHARSEPISFTGLHTSKPTIEYGNQHYDCRWTTDLGTQFHVARPGDVKDAHRPGHAVDVVALSRVRLTGQRITAASTSKKADAAGASIGQAIALDEDEDEEESEGRPQMSFFERVKEIQLRKAKEGSNGVNGASAGENVLPSPHDLPARSGVAPAGPAGLTQLADEGVRAATSGEETDQLPTNVQTAPMSETSPPDKAQDSGPTEVQRMPGNTVEPGKATEPLPGLT